MAILWGLTEPCHYCSAPIEVAAVENGLVPVDDYGQAYCNSECLAAQGEKENEVAHERFLERYYSGEVETQQEHATLRRRRDYEL